MMRSRFFLLGLLAAAALAPFPAAAITDTLPPTMGVITPSSLYKNVAVTFSSDVSDDIAGVDYCSLRIDGIDQGLMTLTPITGGYRATKSYTYTGIAASISVKVACTDRAAVPNSDSRTQTMTVLVDTTGPVVSNLLPATASLGVAVNITVNYAESGSGMNSCGLIVDGDESGVMTLGSGMASLGYTFATLGTHTVQVNCFDNASNYGSASRIVVVSDTTNPTVTNLQPATATQNVAVTVSATATDNVGIASCGLTVDGVASVSSMNYAGTTASQSHTFTTTGSHIVSVSCNDTSSNTTTASGTITVSAPIDATSPTVSGLGPATAVTNSAVMLTASVSDNVGVSSCTLLVDNAAIGAMTISSGVASRSQTFTSAGSYAVEVRCSDAAGNTSTGSLTVTASAPPATADATPPTVGQVPQSAATVGTSLTFFASASDNVGIASCTLYVGDAAVGTMAVSGGNASRGYVFSSAGTYSVYVRCSDAAGLTAAGTARTVTVAAAATTPTPTPTPALPTPIPLTLGGTADTDGDDLSDADEALYGSSPSNRDTDGDGFPDGIEVRNGYNPNGAGRLLAPTTSAAPGRLIKLACPAGAVASNPCKAVYYYGRDGKRHAFPSERIYRTWFSSFSMVQVVDAPFMATLPVGENVLFRPGVHLVKFQTVNTVYAVSRGGILHGIASESVAAALYGSDWGAKLDDVSDILFGDFAFGADVTSSAGFSPASETSSATAIDANF